MSTTHNTPEEFYDAVHDDMLVIRSVGEHWLAWEDEDGDWFAVRPRSDEDVRGPGGDRWRPVGPTLVEALTFPITVAYVHEAFDAARLAKAHSDASWAANMDRQGGA